MSDKMKSQVTVFKFKASLIYIAGQSELHKDPVLKKKKGKRERTKERTNERKTDRQTAEGEEEEEEEEGEEAL